MADPKKRLLESFANVLPDIPDLEQQTAWKSCS